MNHTERVQLLQQVENGQVPVKDAIKQMATPREPRLTPEPVDAQRWLRIRVTNLETGQGKVNVNIPLSWVKLGLALGAGFVPELEDWDVDQVMSSLDQSATGHIVDVEDLEDNQRVEIYVE
jgi:hypothetical protein